MDKEITYQEFYDKVIELYEMGESPQYPAGRARDYFIKQGVTNALEMYEKYKNMKGDLFYYTGD